MLITQEVLNDMPLHTSVGYLQGSLSIEIIRVIGGWIYRITDTDRAKGMKATAVFVPVNT